MRFPLKLSPQSPARKFLASGAIALIASTIALALRYAPGISVATGKLDNLLYDSAYHFRPIQDQRDGPVVIVAVDQKSLDDLANHMVGKTRYGWPWPRILWGYMIAYFDKCGAKAIAFDMIFTEPSVYADLSGDDEAFGKTIDRSKRPVIFGSIISPGGKPGDFAPVAKAPQFG
ncbi:MAG TPA: CHASE2 domain-containing protein, partial [Tepidisphaeraceae bacterium]|nr:CHASE2 domain-containing protein [Tepidisphaeraceae bacterium]